MTKLSYGSGNSHGKGSQDRYTPQHAQPLPTSPDERAPGHQMYAVYGSSNMSSSDSSLTGTSISDKEEELHDSGASHPMDIPQMTDSSAGSSFHGGAEGGDSIYSSKSQYMHGRRSATSCPTAQSSYAFDRSTAYTMPCVDPMSFHHFSVGSLPTKKPVPWPRRMAVQHQQYPVPLSPLEEITAPPYATAFLGKDDEDMIFPMED